MSIEDFLNALTPEQLEHLAELKRAEGTETSTPKSKRKQKRNKKTKEEFTPKAVGPVRRTGKRKKKGTLDKILDKKGSPAKRLGTTPLGDRPNRFADGDLSGFNNTCLEDIEQDKLLIKNRKSIRNSVEKRTVSTLTATCGKCDDVFDNVAANLCYKDDGVYMFVCEDCVRNLH